MQDSCDGWVREAWITCPTCNGKGDHLDTCRRCNGSGKLEQTPDEADELVISAARSHIDASDEEPLGIMERRGIATD
jgi:RecJ-like exonuclease